MRGTLRWIRADLRAHRRLLSPGGTTPRTPRCPAGASPMAKTAIVSGAQARTTHIAMAGPDPKAWGGLSVPGP
jgi:hypothetical protein